MPKLSFEQLTRAPITRSWLRYLRHYLSRKRIRRWGWRNFVRSQRGPEFRSSHSVGSPPKTHNSAWKQAPQVLPELQCSCAEIPAVGVSNPFLAIHIHGTVGVRARRA